MSEYTPKNLWHKTIRQFDINEIVEGGEDGLDNIPHQELADNIEHLLNRIKYLENSNNIGSKPPVYSPEDVETPPVTGGGITTGGSSTDFGFFKITGAPNAAFAINSSPKIIITNTKHTNKEVWWKATIGYLDGTHVISERTIGNGYVTTNKDGAAMIAIGQIPDFVKPTDWKETMKEVVSVTISWGGVRHPQFGYYNAFTGRIFNIGFVQDNTPVIPSNAVE